MVPSIYFTPLYTTLSWLHNCRRKSDGTLEDMYVVHHLAATCTPSERVVVTSCNDAHMQMLRCHVVAKHYTAGGTANVRAPRTLMLLLWFEGLELRPPLVPLT